MASVAGAERPSEAELTEAVEAIARVDATADVVVHGVAEAWVSVHPRERLVFLAAKRREALAAGEAYRTWVVTFFGGAVTEVTSFVSRACGVP